MGDNTLLRRHAERWAESKQRPFDGDLLEVVVDLRHTYDECAANSWPAGSVELLLLERWPAHGPLDLPDPQVLADTLDTFWRFLRATGRMASDSAPPADLTKEARRALPRMADACADRSKFSSGRVLQEFGRTLGIPLDEADDVDELNERLQRITTAWNGLPIQERRRLMPDPSPRTLAGQAVTDLMNAALRQAPFDDEDLDDEAPFDDEDLDDDEVFDDLDDSLDGDAIQAYLRSGARPDAGALMAAGRTARDSAYVRACLALADWVGDGREVTKTGVLRPAVAREAYAALGLAGWESQYRRSVLADKLPETAGPLIVDPREHSWQSARDCVPLDRLWSGLDAAGLVRIGPLRAAQVPMRLETDLDWLALGITLVSGLTERAGFYSCEPLVALVLSLARVADASCDLAEYQRWWRARGQLGAPEGSLTPDVDKLLGQIQDLRLNDVLAMYADTAIWVRDRDRVSLTDFGRQFAAFLANALVDGYLADDEEDCLELVLDYLQAEPFHPG